MQLTSVTTALGLLPMVLGMNIAVFGREIVFGAPATQYWTEVSATISGGLAIATFLTLIVTPAMLMLGQKHPVVERATLELGRRHVPEASILIMTCRLGWNARPY